MADRHESDGRESPESPQTGRSGEIHSKTSGTTSTERDDTQVSLENEYFSALDLDEDLILAHGLHHLANIASWFMEKLELLA